MEGGNIRWFVLVTFLLATMSNAMAWLTFAPVPAVTTQYFGISGNAFALSIID